MRVNHLGIHWVFVSAKSPASKKVIRPNRWRRVEAGSLYWFYISLTFNRVVKPLGKRRPLGFTAQSVFGRFRFASPIKCLLQKSMNQIVLPKMGDLLTHWTHLTLPCQGNHCVEVNWLDFRAQDKSKTVGMYEECGNHFLLANHQFEGKVISSNTFFKRRCNESCSNKTLAFLDSCLKTAWSPWRFIGSTSSKMTGKQGYTAWPSEFLTQKNIIPPQKSGSP